MTRLDFRLRLALMLTTGAVCSLGAHTSARAQAGDGWTFVITPQAWLSHIAKNGFAAPSNNTSAAGVVFNDASGTIFNPLFSITSSPNEAINPQWGIQFAAQKGRLQLAGAFQYVTFETRNNLEWVAPRECDSANGTTACINPGEQWAQEFVNTTRMDMDFSASYFFPDVVRNWLDGALGAGFKFIYATGSRQFRDESDLAALVNTGAFFHKGPGLYTLCQKLDCSDAVPKLRVNEDSQIYGATFPMNATLHLTDDGKWLLPFSITPLLGAEHRNDRNVVYSIDLPANISGLPAGTHVNRLDGWKFAYGVTSDLTVRWIFSEMVSAYAGMRVQYISGFDKYLAYGPLVGMSVRFGGK